ncbi:hypothetical protein ACFQ6Q_04220 [Streptomyces sp. NPDC056437]|uniref:hypothetical protein n=1 Tax=Streptomyces sp. NPDC056437 TaxID=3345816 RepID=UPI0036B8A241
MSTVVTLDLGPGHEADALEVNGEMVCILCPDAATDTRIQERVRRLMKGVGRDCEECRGCPVGKAR